MTRFSLVWEWWRQNYPDLARLCGLVMFVYAGVVDKGRNPALVPAAMGLTLLKTVVNGGGKE